MTMTSRYDTSGNWYKGNTHIHSTASDGGKTFSELAGLYASEGYDFLFRTDHWVASDTAADTESFPLLWIDGIELDGRDQTGAYFHVVCLGKLENLSREMGFVQGMEAARAQGALLILAHPHWSGNSLDDVERGSFDGVEIYNHVCHWLNGKSGGLVHWDAALDMDPSTLAFSVDDAHLREDHMGWNGGWIMVNAESCSSQAILQGIRRGNFYSSCGPVIKTIAIEGNQLFATTSPVRFMRLVGPDSRGDRLGFFDGSLFTEGRMTIPEDYAYAYLEIEDDKGRRAWTNNVFVTEK